MKRFLLLAVAGLCLPFVLSASVSAQVELRYSTWDPPTHEMRANGVHIWAEEVEKVTNGRVKIRFLPKPTGAPPAHYDLLVDGAIDIANIIPGYTPGRFHLHKLMEFPLLTDNPEARAVAFWRVYSKFFEKANEIGDLKLLAVWSTDSGVIHNHRKPITSVADLNGLKLRVANDTIGAIAQSLGASPLFAPVTQLHDLLSRGVADGAFIGFEGIKNFKLDRVLKYTTVVPGGMYATGFYLTVNRKAWDKIQPEDQKAILDISGEKLTQMVGKGWKLANQRGLEVMKQANFEVVTADANFVEAVRKAWAPLEAEWIAEANKKGVDGAAAIEAYKAELAKF
jgi:TRAP-type C4-dicarboxylate transport system substrate-binding protein